VQPKAGSAKTDLAVAGRWLARLGGCNPPYKLSASFFKIRVGVKIRLVFQIQPDGVLFVMAGSHAEPRRFLRGR